MAILRHHRVDNFTTVNNHFVNNRSLSLKAKGVMVYLLSKPEYWEVRVRDIVNSSRDGVDSVKSAMKELRDHGYLVLNRGESRFPDGTTKFGSFYDVYEQPQGVHP